MLTLPAIRRLSAQVPFRIIFRLATLVAYSGSLILLHHAEFLAESVYDNLCSREGIAFDKPISATGLALVMVVLSIPTVLARSRALIAANLVASLFTVAGALLLLSTASDTPYECFTMGGTYEDHTAPPPIQWTPVVGSASQEVFDGKTSTTSVYERLQATSG